MIERLDSRSLLSSIAGLWAGSRTEKGLSGTFGTVSVDMNLTQSRTVVTGTERRSSPIDKEYFVDIITGGTFVGNTFALRDQSITSSQTTSNYTWLLYKATLQLSPDGQTLSGTWHAGNIGGTMTLERVPLPLFTLTAAHAHHPNGITVHYRIATAAITHPLLFQVYRSTDSHLNSSAELIGSQTLSPKSHANRLTIGSHRVTLLSKIPLTGDKKRPYVIIVANGKRAVVEADGSSNVTFFRLHSF